MILPARAGEDASAANAKTKKPARPLFEVRKSKIAGKGVFALRRIASGKRITEYIGERISHEEATARYDDESMEQHHTFLFTVNDDVVIDAMRVGNDAKYINHSCEPNCEAVEEDGRIFVYAIRDIEPGEELTYDYWYTTDPGYSDADLKRMYPCRCGAELCRGTIAAPRKKKKKAKKKP